jgi:hypothetical protein
VQLEFEAFDAGLPDNAVNLLAVFHDDEARNARYSVPDGQFTVLIDVDPLHFVAIADEDVNRRRHLPARTAPIGVEVVQHSLAAARGRRQHGQPRKDDRSQGSHWGTSCFGV